ncbi:MAG: dockerin type I repeat-containing protein [Bacteroidaceae bacterium]|nr:dockerin type I repeat-containing protein [Bacteroidaceae bacterium]
MNTLAKLLILLCLLPLSLTVMSQDDNAELLTNGACDGTFNGWETTNYGEAYQWEIFEEEDGTHSWLSPYYMCTLRQTIDLAEKNISAEAIDKGEVWLKGSVQVISTNSTTNHGLYKSQVTVEMLDAEDNILKKEMILGDSRSFASWATFGKTFQLVSGTRKVSLVVGGESLGALDVSNGPRFRNISLTRTEQLPEPLNSVELLTNGACDGTFDGWTASQGTGKKWAIRTEEDGTYSWLSDFLFCTLQQTVDLDGKNVITDAIDKGEVVLKASAQIMTTMSSNNKGARVAGVLVEMLDAADSILETYTVFFDLSVFENWTTFDGMLPLVPGTRKLSVLVEGKDAAGWSGHYGPRFRNFSLTIDKNALYSRADVNRDAKVNTTDVVAVYTYIEQGDDSGFTRDFANVNRDDKINTADVVAIYDIIINGESDDTPALLTNALPYPFSVSDTKAVLFADGNLQYVDDNWQFASEQYEDFGTFQSDNHKDMFPYNSYTCPKGWYCLTNDEWEYLLTKRTVSNTLSDGALYTLATLGNAYKGMIVFPDEYTHPAGTGFTAGTYNVPSDFTATVSLDGWKLMEKAGAMFLPCSGYKSMGETWKGVHNEGCYMTTTPGGRGYYDPYFGSTFVSLSETSNTSTWSSVRLVR